MAAGVSLSAIVFAILFVSSVSAGTVGFGSAILFQVAWVALDGLSVSDTGDLTRAQAILIVQSVLAATLLFSLGHTHVRWKFLLYFVPGQMSCLAVGNYLLVSAPAQVLKDLLACVFLVFAGVRWRAVFKADVRRLEAASSPTVVYGGEPEATTDDVSAAAPPPESDSSGRTPDVVAADAAMRKWPIVVTGMASGFLQGVFGTGGPPLMFYFSIVPAFTKEEIRSTVQTATLISAPVRIGLAFAFGIWDGGDWPLYVAAVVACVSGIFFGNMVHRRVDKDIAIKCLLSLVLLSIIPLLRMSDPFTFVVLGLYVAVVVYVIVMLVWIAVRESVPPDAVRKASSQADVHVPLPRMSPSGCEVERRVS